MQVSTVNKKLHRRYIKTYCAVHEMPLCINDDKCPGRYAEIEAENRKTVAMLDKANDQCAEWN